MLPNRSVCTNSSLFDIFQPVLFGQCYGVNTAKSVDTANDPVSNLTCV